MLGRLSVRLFVQILSGDLRLQQGSYVCIGSQRWGCVESEWRERTVSEDVSDAGLLPSLSSLGRGCVKGGVLEMKSGTVCSSWIVRASDSGRRSSPILVLYKYISIFLSPSEETDFFFPHKRVFFEIFPKGIFVILSWLPSI